MITPQHLATALTAVLLSSPVLAVTTLDFENIEDEAQVLSYYDGGKASLGNNTGPDVGAVFNGNAYVLTSGSFDPTQAPSPVGVMTLFDDKNGQVIKATLNIQDGFVGTFSGWYSAIANSNVNVLVYETADGAGNPFASTGPLDSTNGTTCTAGDPNASFRCWKPFSISLNSKVGHSVVFSGVQLLSIFDNVQFTPYAPPAAPIPEPGTWALMLAGLAGTGWLARRRSAT